MDSENTGTLGGIADRLKQVIADSRARADEHERRMASDPEYRAEFDRKEAERKAQDDESAALARESKRRMRCRDARVPERVVRHLADPRPTAAWDHVRAFIDSPLTIQILSGGEGCSKTVSACRALAEKGGLYVKAAALMRARFDDEEWRTILRARPLLVIDDVGVEARDEKGWAMAALYELLDRRYDDCLQTILTTNLTKKRFVETYCAEDGGRLLGRLRECGQYVEIDAPSMRVAP